MREYAYISCLRRNSRLKMKLIPSPARFAAWGFFVSRFDRRMDELAAKM